MVIGISGACRCEEMVKMVVDDIQDLGSAIHIRIPNNKTRKPRSFTIVGEQYLSIYKNYASLRPEGMREKRFFLKFVNGRCCRMVMGIHKISAVPKEAAVFLKLPGAIEYTGHCLRRTSATLLVDAGADITCLKRHGGWKSSTVAEGYIDESMTNKKDIAKKILQPNNNKSITNNLNTAINSTESGFTESSTLENTETTNQQAIVTSSLNFSGATINNCTFNVVFK